MINPIQWVAKKFSKPTQKREFNGAAVNRLTIGLPQSSTSVNADLDGALVILRSRARGLCANTEFGRRFLTLVANNVIGPKGPTLQVRRFGPQGKLDKSLNDTIEIHWARWAKRCDVTGKLNLTTLLKIAIKSVARDGEVLIRVVRGSQYPYGFALQLLESDRLDEKYNARLQNGNRIRQGIEINSAGMPVAYHVHATHPGDNWQSMTSPSIDRVPARDMYHLFLPERAEQLRGYTWFHAVLMRANMLDGFLEAAIVAARLGASKVAAFTRSEDAAAGNLDEIADVKNGNTLQTNAEPGEFIDLTGMPGTKLEGWNPEYPHANFESFVTQCMHGISSGLDVATHNLSGNMSGVNYSSARIAELSEHDTWIGLQEWLIDGPLFPIFKEWLNIGLLTGRITFIKSGVAVSLDRYVEIVDNTRFQGRRWDWVDPLKEAQAARERIASGLDSRTNIAASRGREFEDIADELAQEKEIMQTAGIIGEAPTITPQEDEKDAEVDE